MEKKKSKIDEDEFRFVGEEEERKKERKTGGLVGSWGLMRVMWSAGEKSRKSRW